MTVQRKITKVEWEKEFTTGKWDYLETSPIERARHALIGMYVRCLAPKAKILDVGCGLGTTTDFLDKDQKRNYLGIDISDIAIKKAKKLKKACFKKFAFLRMPIKKKFDVIIFNEVLYYLDDAASFQHALKLLNKNGLVVISLYQTKKMKYNDRVIWETSRKFFVPIENVEVKGVVRDGRLVTWRIEVLKRR